MSDFDVQAEKERFLSSITEGDYEDLGVTGLRHHGGYSSGFCPIHQDEKKRSLSLRPSGKTGYLDWICFAGCGESRARNFVEMVMLLEGRDPDDHRSFVETLKELVTGERPVFAHRPSGNGKKPKPKADVDWAWFVEKCQGNVPAEIPVEVVPHGFTPESWRRALLVTGGGLMPDTTDRRWEPEKPWLGKRRAWVWGTVSNDGSYVGAKLRWVDGPWTPYPDGDPEKCWSLGTAGLMGAYQLEDRPDVPVVVTEGEMDMGMGASVDGCYAWVSFSSFGPTTYERAGGRLAGRSVVATYDMDEAGRGHAAVAERCLVGVASDYRDVSIPFGEGESGKDLRDWFEAGHTLVELVSVVDGTPLSSSPEPGPAPSPSDMRDVVAAKAQHPELDEAPDPAAFVQDEQRSLPEFPVEVFPGHVRRYVESLRDNLQVSVDLPSVAVFGAVSASVTGLVDVRLNPTWDEQLCLYVAVAMAPGEMKSRILKEVFHEVHEWARREREESVRSLDEALAKKELLEDAQKQLKGAIRLAKKKGAFDEERLLTKEYTDNAKAIKEIERKRAVLLVLNDITPEQLGPRLMAQDERVSVIAAEGNIMAVIEGVYNGGRMTNFGLFNSAWTGEPFVGDRKTSAEVDLENPAVTMALLVQPHVVSTGFENEALMERGFIPRFLISFPVSRVGYRGRFKPVPAGDRSGFGAMMESILDLPVVRDERGKVVRHVLRFTEVARERLLRFTDEAEKRIGPLGVWNHMVEWGNKARGQVTRLAALLHLMKWGGLTFAKDQSDEVTHIQTDTVADAVKVLEYFAAHEQVVYDAGGQPGPNPLLQYMVGWLRRHPDKNRISLRDITKIHKFGLKENAGLVVPVIESLVHMGVFTEIETRRKDSRAWAVNRVVLAKITTEQLSSMEVSGGGGDS